ncbi:hypothetical protein TWF481_004886 [Arthrobotrys musiformis]|uniref:Uncharacterized protein n=1 Tax=Arthrobotrys musiformis TaxID=47236 RepID=A0AAV9WL34_9PEZI
MPTPPMQGQQPSDTDASGEVQGQPQPQQQKQTRTELGYAMDRWLGQPAFTDGLLEQGGDSRRAENIVRVINDVDRAFPSTWSLLSLHL